MKPVYITSDTLNSIYKTLCMFPAECGGVIACDQRGQIADFYFDHEAGAGKSSYSPSISTVNRIVNDKWLPGGLRFSGIAHSHPPRAKLYPSNADLLAAKMILQNNEGLEEILLMITRKEDIKVWEMKLNQTLRECKLYVK